jgi:hypothetical protein
MSLVLLLRTRLLGIGQKRRAAFGRACRISVGVPRRPPWTCPSESESLMFDFYLDGEEASSGY